MENYKFSYFFDKVKGVKCVVPTKEVTLVDLFNLVKSNESIKKITELYRETGDKTYKEKLPFFTPAGIFKKKSDAQFLEHTSDTYNWVIPFDIDKKDNLHIEDWEGLFVNKIATNPHVLLAFVSPSGGIKGILCGERDGWKLKTGKGSLHSDVMKKRFYPQLETEWGVKLDPAQATLSQSMFISHDPFAHCNPDASPMTGQTSVSAAAVIDNFGDDALTESFIAIEDYLKALQNTKENKWQRLSGIFYFIGRATAGKLLPGNPEEIKATLLKAFHANPYLEDRELGEKKMIRSWEMGLEKPIPIEQFLTKKALKELFGMVKTFMLNNDMSHLMRIGDDYFEVRDVVNRHTGVIEHKLKSMSRITFLDDYGKDAHHQIQKLHGFCNKPNYFGKSRITDDQYNLWPMLPYTPAPGLVDKSLYMISHICSGDKRLQNILLDYLYLAMFKPEQLLFILALVSKAQGTGKTTFLEWVEKIFAGNAVIMESSKFEDPFNMSYATKHMIMIDEGEYRNDKKGIANKMKKWATQKSVLVNEKFMKSTTVDYYGRIIIASNQEDSFIKIEDDDVRYFVLKVPQFPQEEKSATFVQELTDEIPAFVHYLKERGLNKKHSGGERFWYSPQELETPWLKTIRKKTKDDLTWEIMTKVRDWFTDQEDGKEYLQTTKTNFKGWLDARYDVGFKYLTTTLEKIGAEIDKEPSRGNDDLKEGYYKVTGLWIRIHREKVDEFFKDEENLQILNKTTTAQKLL